MLVNNGIIATGERFIPESKDDELEIEHLERYLSIKELVRDKIVLDAACGEGYGSYILSQTATTVLGVDIDPETIQNAKDKYGTSSRLNYMQASVADLGVIPSDSIEVVVSYETIEHIDAQNQIEFLKEISRVLKHDGILIMSTPDKKEYSDKYDFQNPFHVKEFYVPEFVDFLHSKFKNIKLYNQYLEVAAFIDCPEENIKQIQYSVDKSRYTGVAKYVIALASNSCLPDKSIAMAKLHLHREYMPMMEELNYCRKEAIECRKKVKILDECLNENKLNCEELGRREIELQKRMDLINELGRKNIAVEIELQKRISLIDELDRKNIVAEQEIKNQKEELNHRMGEINRRDKEIAKQRNELKLAEEELERRAKELLRRMEEINSRDREIDRQHNELKLAGEELERRAEELNNRMNKINELREELENIKTLNLSGIIKWYFNKVRK